MPVPTHGRVLIVDDDPEFGLVAKSLIEVEGFSGRLALAAPEALELASNESFDVVLLDLMLGETSGLDLLRTLKSHHPQLPIILVTAHGSIETAAEALQARSRLDASERIALIRGDAYGQAGSAQEAIAEITRVLPNLEGGIMAWQQAGN